MADLYPVVSPLHKREEVEKIIELYSETLQLQCVSEVPTEGVVLVLVCTGGTEQFIVEAARINPEVILLAHEKQNSLPAALEAREKLKVMDIHSKIIFGLDDASLAELESAIQIFEVVQTLRTSRIGIFGFPSPWLINLPHFSRAEHLGTTFVHIDLSQVVREVSQTVSGIEFEADRIECTKDDVKRAVTLYQALKNIVEREKLHALGIKCFDLIELLNTTGCLAVSLLNDAGIPAGCEADMPATVTMYIVQLLTGTPPFMGNLCSVSENEIFLAHCTIATQLTETVVLKPHFESGAGVSIQGTLPKGSSYPGKAGRCISEDISG
ncbi:MAG: hypothetical protein AYK18_15345 [Theionarchaea archaeon DG-70]|nr:MAG: hypothetical protein AYK18_15345 [Theionarchaea archaeon DG-70]